MFCSRYIDHILYGFLRRLESKHAVRILSSRHNEWTERLERAGHAVHVLAPRSRFDRRYKAALSRLYADRPWDLVHCFHGNAELANHIRWARGRVPIVAYRAYIGHLTFRESPLIYWGVRHPGLAAVVAVSSAVKDYLESFRWLRPPNVRVIGHGIDAEWIAAQTSPPYGLREKLGLAPEDLVVAMMANLRAYKRFDLVLKAAERLADRGVHFVHLGEDRGWKERAKHLDNLHFPGYLPSPWAAIAEADVFATTAHNEAFGRSNLEALACGKPLIGSDTGGLLDLVDDGVNGRLFNSGDAEDFAAKVLFYAQNRQAVQRHSENARSLVKQRLSAETMAERYAQLYREVLARARPAPGTTGPVAAPEPHGRFETRQRRSFTNLGCS